MCSCHVTPPAARARAQPLWPSPLGKGGQGSAPRTCDGRPARPSRSTQPKQDGHRPCGPALWPQPRCRSNHPPPAVQPGERRESPKTLGRMRKARVRIMGKVAPGALLRWSCRCLVADTHPHLSDTMAHPLQRLAATASFRAPLTSPLGCSHAASLHAQEPRRTMTGAPPSRCS